MTRRPDAVRLLTGQALAFGGVAGFLIIPTAGVFLAAYGSEGLPWVYLAVAGAGGALVPVMSHALQRWPLDRVATVVTSIVTGLLLSAWLGLEAGGGPWIAFVLEVVFPLVLQFGFLLIGAQAGRLLTLREMKERFVRIVSGFVVGFFLAGLAAGPLLSWFGETHRLLALAALSAGAFVALVVRTGAAFGESFEVDRSTPTEATGPAGVSIGRLVRQRIVVVLLAYQLLSVLGTQLVDFLVYDRAAARYASSAELARFTSFFTVVLNLVDIVFVVFVAGTLLRRYGMRLGLVANPAMILLLLVGAVALGGTSGVASLAVFTTIGAARVFDISLTDGATRGAINTAYQAMPPAERLAAQNAVEGIGQPAAIGLTGALLLIVEHVFDAGVTVVLGIAVTVAVAWTLVGVAAYRAYRGRLHDSLRSRLLHPDSAPVGAGAVGAAELARALADPSIDERQLLRALRRCPRDDDPGLAEVLASHLPHPSRDVGLELLRALAKATVPGDPRRATAFDSTLSTDGADVVRVAEALTVLDPGQRSGPLGRALDDERRLLRDRALAAISLVTDPDAVRRAARWLDSGDPRAAATALESIELLVPTRQRLRCVALLRSDADPEIQLAAAAAAFGIRTRSDRAAVLSALSRPERSDPASRWTASCCTTASG